MWDQDHILASHSTQNARVAQPTHPSRNLRAFLCSKKYINIRSSKILPLQDTAGQEAFEALRKLSYADTKVYLVGFDCTKKMTLDNIKNKWIPEIKNETNNDDLWIIVVGLKKDMHRGEIKQHQVDEICKDIDACCFVNTSAKIMTDDDAGITRLRSFMIKLAQMWDNHEQRPGWGQLANYKEAIAYAAPPDNTVEEAAVLADEQKERATSAQEQEMAKKAEEKKRNETMNPAKVAGGQDAQVIHAKKTFKAAPVTSPATVAPTPLAPAHPVAPPPTVPAPVVAPTAPASSEKAVSDPHMNAKQGAGESAPLNPCANCIIS